MKKNLLSVIGLLMAVTTITAEDFDVTKDYNMSLRITGGMQLPMTFKGNGVYEITTNAIGANTFKIADLSGSVNYGGDFYPVNPSEEYMLYKDGQIEIAFNSGELQTGDVPVKVTISANWDAFLHAQRYVPSAVVDTKAPSDVIVTASNGTIFTEGEFEIFDMSGKNVTAQNGRLNGNYIVVVNNQSVKVRVK